MQLQHASWPEVEAYLGQRTLIIVPIGSTEQHGSNGLIGTDAICPEVIARGIGEETGTLIAPTLNIGMAQHHMEFPGSITFRPSTLMQVLLDVIESLAKHGFQDIYFLNGHGGNIATITAAFAEYYAQFSLSAGSDGIAKTHLRNWWNGSRIQGYSKANFRNEGAHATPTEVSLTYFAIPTAVKNVELKPRVAPWSSYYDAVQYRQVFPDGRIGSDPSEASIAHGEAIYKAAVADTCEHLVSLGLLG